MSCTNLDDSQEAIDIISQKDKKIAELKRQLQEVKARNIGLENCVKNQDSAVRKIGSLVASPRSSASTDTVSTQEIEDVIDDVYRKIRRMEDIDSQLTGSKKGFEKGSIVSLKGDLKVDEPRRHENGQNKNKRICQKEQNSNENGKQLSKHNLEGKMKTAERQIFASERAFRQIAKEQPVDDKILSMRLEQLREERDNLFDIIKHYEPMMEEKSNDDGNVEERMKGAKRFEIEAKLTLEDKINNEREKKELLYHIDELRKCLEDIKKKKAKKKERDTDANKRQFPVDFQELKARIDQLEAKNRLIDGREFAPQQQLNKYEWPGFNGRDGPGRKLHRQELREDFVGNPMNGNFKTYESNSDRDRSQPNPQLGYNQPTKMANSSTDGPNCENLSYPRRRSLVAEKPGILSDSEAGEGNHVTRVLSDRILELEKEDKKKNDKIFELENKLSVADGKHQELAKINYNMLQTVNEMVNLCKPTGSDGATERRLPEMEWNDELWKEFKDAIKQVVDENSNSMTKSNELEQKYTKALKKLDELSEEKQAMGETINDLNSKDERHCAKVEQLENEADQMKAQIEKLQKGIEERQSSTETAESRLAECEADLQNEKENSILFKNMIQQAEKIKENLENEIQVVNSKYQNAEKIRLELEKCLEDDKTKIEELLANEKQLKQEIVGQRSENDLALKEMEDLNRTLERTQQDLLDALKYKPLLDDAKKKLAVQQESKAKLEERINETNKILEDALNKNKELKSNVEEKERELIELRTEVDSSKQENERLNGLVGNMKKETTDQKLKIEEYENEIKNLQIKVNKRNGELTENQKELSKERGKVNKCTEELKEKNEEILKIQKERDEIKRQHGKLQKELEGVIHEKELLEERVSDGEKSLNVLQMELNSLQKLSETLDSEKNNLLQKLEIEAENNFELQRVKEKIMEENERLEMNLKTEEESNLNKEMQLTEAEKRIDDKTNIVNELDNEIKILEDQNEKLVAEIKSANLETAKIEEEGKELRERIKQNESEFSGLQKSLETAWKEKENLQQILGKHITENKVLHEELRKTENIGLMKDDKIEELDHENLEYREQMSTLENRINLLTSNLQEVTEKLIMKEERVIEMDKKVQERDDKLASFYVKNNNLLENIAKKNKEIDGLRGKNKDLEEANGIRDSEIERLKLNATNLESKHLAEIKEKDQKWQLFDEYNKSLSEQLEVFKKREKRFLENGNLMKVEVDKLTDELKKAKVILKDFQQTLMDKDNDLKKINDAVILLENAYATRQAGLQKQMKKLQEELEAATENNNDLGKRLVQKEDENDTLQNEIDNLVKRLKNEEEVVMQMQEDNEKLEDSILRIKRALVEGGQKLGRKEHEVNELRNKLVHDGREVEDLIEQLETTLRNVREQLWSVENEKASMQELMQDDAMRIQEQEMSINEMKQELQQKDEDLMLEKAKKTDLQKQLEDRSKEKEDRKMIEELKTELFKVGREKQLAVVNLTKERDGALLEKTAEKLAKDNLKLQMKNLKDEIANIKKRKDEKSHDHDRYVEELKRMLGESREREKDAVAREGEYKLKLKEMSGTVRILERRIEDAVMQAEEEKKRREEILTQLIRPLEAVEKEISNKDRIDSDKWKKRAANLQSNIDDLKEQFSKYKNRAMADNEAMKTRISNAKDEEILKLKLDLEEAERNRTALQRKVNDLSTEIITLDNKRQKSSKDKNRLSEELRLAKQEAMIQKHELDWLRHAMKQFGKPLMK